MWGRSSSSLSLSLLRSFSMVWPLLSEGDGSGPNLRPMSARRDYAAAVLAAFTTSDNGAQATPRSQERAARAAKFREEMHAIPDKGEQHTGKRRRRAMKLRPSSL